MVLGGLVTVTLFYGFDMPQSHRGENYRSRICYKFCLETDSEGCVGGHPKACQGHEKHMQIK